MGYLSVDVNELEVWVETHEMQMHLSDAHASKPETKQIGCIHANNQKKNEVEKNNKMRKNK